MLDNNIRSHGGKEIIIFCLLCLEVVALHDVGVVKNVSLKIKATSSSEPRILRSAIYSFK